MLLAGDPPNRAQLATRPLVAALAADAAAEAAATEPAAQFVAPEVAGGGGASAAADVYAFGAVLRWLWRATAAGGGATGGARAGAPAAGEDELRTLVARLLVADPRARPSAADVALHPYFTDSYVDRYVAGGDIVGVNAKLAAVRDLLAAVRSASRRVRADLAVARGPGLADRVLAFFGRDAVAARRRGGGGEDGAAGVPPARRPLRVTFEGEAGVDEGGLAREMFALFFEGALAPAAGLFEDAGGEVLLPARLPRGEGAAARAARADRLEAFGRALVAALYEGCGAPPRLGPSLFKYLAHGAAHAAAGDGRALRDLQKFDPALGASLERMLARAPPDGQGWGLDFGDVSSSDDDAGGGARAVTEANKHAFVVLKVRRALVGRRRDALEAIRRGFVAALRELSPEAAPFLKLFSSTDWRVLLCADDDRLTPDRVLDALAFVGWPKRSVVPDALRRSVRAFDKDSLRRFLVFATGSPGLPSAPGFEIQVRAQPRSPALPVAHTCFFHLDIPDYADEGEFVAKLTTAILECGTFDRV